MTSVTGCSKGRLTSHAAAGHATAAPWKWYHRPSCSFCTPCVELEPRSTGFSITPVGCNCRITPQHTRQPFPILPPGDERPRCDVRSLLTRHRPACSPECQPNHSCPCACHLPPSLPLSLPPSLQQQGTHKAEHNTAVKQQLLQLQLLTLLCNCCCGCRCCCTNQRYRLHIAPAQASYYTSAGTQQHQECRRLRGAAAAAWTC